MVFIITKLVKHCGLTNTIFKSVWIGRWEVGRGLWGMGENVVRSAGKSRFMMNYQLCPF